VNRAAESRGKDTVTLNILGHQGLKRASNKPEATRQRVGSPLMIFD